MTPTILITGAAGFAGSHLIDRLSAGDEPATLVAWHRPGRPPAPEIAARRTVTWQGVDLLDRAAVQTALSTIRPAFVYHCAGEAHVGRSWTSTAPTFAINVRGTHHLIEALRETGNRSTRVLIPGSALVYAARDEPISEDDPLVPGSPYAVSKLAQELLADGNHDGPFVLVARAFNHIGPRQDPWFAAAGFARRIADIEAGKWAPEIAVGNLEARRDLTDVRDTVRAYQVIAERGIPGRPYNVCSGRATAIGDVLRLLLDRARVPIEIRADPARYRPNDLPVLLGNPRRLNEELGWRAEIPLERTLDELLDFWRARAAAAT